MFKRICQYLKNSVIVQVIFYDKLIFLSLQVRKVMLNDLHDMLTFKEPKYVAYCNNITVSYCIILSLSDTHPLCLQTKILNKRVSLVPSIIIRGAASRSKKTIFFVCIDKREVIKSHLCIKLTAM